MPGLSTNLNLEQVHAQLDQFAQTNDFAVIDTQEMQIDGELAQVDFDDYDAMLADEYTLAQKDDSVSSYMSDAPER